MEDDTISRKHNDQIMSSSRLAYRAYREYGTPICSASVVRKAYSGRRREAENGVSLAPLSNRLLSRALGRTNPMGR
ncbi:hypothetical protein OXX79_012333 [Metschnikowia pulcherrima]